MVRWTHDVPVDHRLTIKAFKQMEASHRQQEYIVIDLSPCPWSGVNIRKEMREFVDCVAR